MLCFGVAYRYGCTMAEEKVLLESLNFVLQSSLMSTVLHMLFAIYNVNETLVN